MTLQRQTPKNYGAVWAHAVHRHTEKSIKLQEHKSHLLRLILNSFPSSFGPSRMRFSITNKKPKQKNITSVDCNDINAPWKSGSSKLYTYPYLWLSMLRWNTFDKQTRSLRSNSRSHPCSINFMSHFIFILSARSVVRHSLRVCADLNRSLQVFP